MGYYLAGFRVVGIDIEPQPHYPFEFYQADALTYPLEGFDAYHASPPCYENTWSARRWINGNVKYVQKDCITEIREYLLSANKPFVIENVPGADMNNYIRLDGTMFGLAVIRERWFELHGFEILLLPGRLSPKAPVKSGKYFTVAGHGGESKDCRLITWQEAMGIGWMTKQELTQAIPPAYTEYIGRYLIEALR